MKSNAISSPEAIELYKASFYCYKVERRLKLVLVVMALTFSLLSIIVKFWPEILFLCRAIEKRIIVDGVSVENPKFTELSEMSVAVGKVLSFISGIWLIIQMIISHHANIKHKEAVNIEERYDILVLGLEPNKNIMRPITTGMIRNYANRVSFSYRQKFAKDITFLNSSKQTILNYQKNTFEDTYAILVYSKNKFFNYIWWLYFIIIIAFSLFMNTKITDALTSIFFPSLSAISLIVSSMISYNEQFRYNSNAIDCLKSIEDDIKSSNGQISNQVLRNVQDSLFISRLNSFSVPDFVARSYRKKMQKIQEKNAKILAKTEPITVNPPVKVVLKENPKSNIVPKKKVNETPKVDKNKSKKTNTKKEKV